VRRLLKCVVFCAVVAACATAIPPTDVVLSEDQLVDLLSHSHRWYGRTLTVKIYPYDNGFHGSYVACFERCNAAYAQKNPVLIYTKTDRFKGYRGDRPVIVRAVFRKICPENMPLCLDYRIFALDELYSPNP